MDDRPPSDLTRPDPGRSPPTIRVEAFEVPIDRYYEPEHHLWVSASGSDARIGLDVLGQEVSGTIAFVSLLALGRRVTRGEPFGSIESAKYVGQLVAPVGGELTAVNEEVLRDARLLNRDPFGAGWLVVLRGVQPEELQGLVRGEDAVRRYFVDAIRSYRRKGVLADSIPSSAARSSP
jgi:glycine cleavage system H protein